MRSQRGASGETAGRQRGASGETAGSQNRDDTNGCEFLELELPRPPKIEDSNPIVGENDLEAGVPSRDGKNGSPEHRHPPHDARHNHGTVTKVEKSRRRPFGFHMVAATMPKAKNRTVNGVPINRSGSNPAVQRE